MFSITLKVRYAETDQMGVVYYANYFVWMEVVRTQWFESCCGYSYAALEKKGLFLPVLEAKCEYRNPVFYPEEVTVGLVGKVEKNLYITFDYKIEVNGSLRAIGFTKHVLIDKMKKIVRPLPDFIINALK